VVVPWYNNITGCGCLTFLGVAFALVLLVAMIANRAGGGRHQEDSVAPLTFETATGAVGASECMRLAQTDPATVEGLRGLDLRAVCGCVTMQPWRRSKTLRAGLTYCADAIRGAQAEAAEDLAKQTPQDRARLARLRAQCAKSRTVLRFSKAVRGRVCECATPSGLTPGGLTDAEYQRGRNMLSSAIESCADAATHDGLQ
jgi:hypothetical protein